MRRFITFRVLALLAVLGCARSAAPQDLLQQVRDLYSSAAYEDALSLVVREDAVESNLDLEQYRVFCLVALGRSAEAERTAEAVIGAHPLYHPAAGDASPRIRELFAQVRRRLAPDIVRRAYQEGKAALDRKDRAAAIAAFDTVLRIIDDPDVRDDAALQDLKLLGSGFLVLSRALPVPLAPEAKASPPTRPPPVSPAPAAPPPAAVTRSIVSPPVAIREQLPAWFPTDPLSRAQEFTGAVRVQISAEGTVVSAEIISPVHPIYDRLLLRAAKDWTYEPGRSNGQPVPSEKVVQVRLLPR